MKTYQDLQKAIAEGYQMQFCLDVINTHKSGEMYRTAIVARDYMKKKNTTINEYQKLLYTITGSAVPDNYSANYKLSNAFFPLFVVQENSYLLGNGVTFNDSKTKDKLGGEDFDNVLYEVGEYSLWGGLAFGFFNLDKVQCFNILEFAPLWDEKTGALMAGVRFWQIDDSKPLRATLFEVDGYTEYMWSKDEDGSASGEIIKEKTPYKLKVAKSEADGEEIIDGQNYESFPIVPLWGNKEHQSELTGLRETIDAYDLIQSGFANDIDDASMIYWTITNAGGMNDIDLVKFVERMKTVKAAVVDEQGSHAEAHTMDVPHEARMRILATLHDSLYRDAMALDTEKISGGQITATAIRAAYENLNLKCDKYEMCIIDFIKGLLALAGVDDAPTFKRSKIINMAEDTQMILSAAQYLDSETILRHLPFLSPDEIEEVMKRKNEEEAERFEMAMAMQGQPTGMDAEVETEGEEGIE